MTTNYARRSALTLASQRIRTSSPVRIEVFGRVRNPQYMKSRAILAIICVAGVMADPAQARLGETRDECKTRYGAATVGRIELGEELQQSGKDWESAVYSAHGLKIQVVFAEGKAVFIEYSNEPIFSLGSGSDFARRGGSSNPTWTIRVSPGKTGQFSFAWPQTVTT